MSNAFLTPQAIAREALMVLHNNLVMGGLVHKDYSDEFSAKIGDTVTIRKPATFTAKEFPNNDGNIDVQDIVEGSTTVKLDKHLDVSFEITAQELTLDIEDLSARVITPAMQAIAQKIDELLCGLYVDVPFYAGTAGQAPRIAPDVANCGKILNINKAPMTNRSIVIDPVAQANLITLPSFMEAHRTGSTDALRNANLGKLLGFDTYMDQNIVAHTAGTLAPTVGTNKIVIKANVAAGGTKVVLKDSASDSPALTGKVNKGDILNIGNYKFVVTAEATVDVSSDEIEVKFYPPAPAQLTANTVVTVTASHTANLAFHKHAFALVTRPLAIPMGNSEAEYISHNGLGLRVVKSYDINKKKDVISLDMLCGVKTLTPELACRMFGTSA